MAGTTDATQRSRFLMWRRASSGFLATVAVWTTWLLPLALLYARAIGDVMLTVITVLFLVVQIGRRDFGWLRTPWTWLGLLLCGWVVLSSLLAGWMAGALPEPLPGAGAPAGEAAVQWAARLHWAAVEQAVAALRFFIFIPALEYWVLVQKRARRVLGCVFLAAAVWILVECWQQYLLGLNLFGYPRWADGALTGPFRGPTAGPTYLQLFFPAFLPLCFGVMRKNHWSGWMLGILIPAVAAATMILIGQRMPTLLMALGLFASGLLFRQFRLPVIVTALVGVAVLALLPVLSPPAFAKLVVHFTDQMQHFWATQYGLVFGRAMTMIAAHPWIGLGWDGYRDNCMQPAYLHGVAWLPITDPANPLGCTIHPHNYWLQVGTSAGVFGLLLFGALVGLWLWRIRGGAAYQANDWRAALLVALFVMFWPIASDTSLFTVPNAAWIFLMVGWGLAEARWAEDRRDQGASNP